MKLIEHGSIMGDKFPAHEDHHLCDLEPGRAEYFTAREAQIEVYRKALALRAAPAAPAAPTDPCTGGNPRLTPLVSLNFLQVGQELSRAAFRLINAGEPSSEGA